MSSIFICVAVFIAAFLLSKIETEAAEIVTGTGKQTVNDDIKKGE